ncbi:MAG: PIG-L family deacetylase [Alphaproteobacteria bacterium]|nr:PIG-L family deacetylase [Alphaproteobacteria bacterium]
MSLLLPPGARVLVLAPHPDDAEFGCGATLHRFRAAIEAHILVFSDRAATRGEKNNDADQLAAAARLGIPAGRVHFVDAIGGGFARLPTRLFGSAEARDRLRLIAAHAVKLWRPDVILMPSIEETNQDHTALAEEVRRVIRGGPALFGYEVVKHNRDVHPRVFVEVAEADMAAKCEALACFSEFTNRFYFDPEVLRAQARFRAMQAGITGFCEAFTPYYQLDRLPPPAAPSAG